MSFFTYSMPVPSLPLVVWYLLLHNSPLVVWYLLLHNSPLVVWYLFLHNSPLVVWYLFLHNSPLVVWQDCIIGVCVLMLLASLVAALQPFSSSLSHYNAINVLFLLFLAATLIAGSGFLCLYMAPQYMLVVYMYTGRPNSYQP